MSDTKIDDKTLAILLVISGMLKQTSSTTHLTTMYERAMDLIQRDRSNGLLPRQ
jgi:hypothetical protein